MSKVNPEDKKKSMDFVRVQDEHGNQFTTRRAVAKRQDLQILKKDAVDSSGKVLPAKKAAFPKDHTQEDPESTSEEETLSDWDSASYPDSQEG